MSVEMKIMSFNIRVRVERDGANCQDFRREKLISVIRKEAPDVIGFQEVQDASLKWLSEALPEYTFLGYGRDQHYSGEFVPIAFRTDRFALLGFDQKWLSFSERKPASLIKGLDQNLWPRVYAHADLLLRGTHTPFSFYNVHTDHQGPLVRLAECTLLLHDAATHGLPFVMTGDFNACPDEPSITMITGTNEELGTQDLTANLAPTFHGFGKVEKIKIDYIFSNLPADPARSYAVPDDDSCGCYYSDHNAVCAYVTIEE
ncbi:MAG: endonuclease/exonuclease/phosphatase family protein [Clostridia bacterium]|jgi:endonuclease/exonuclease/phosphatase family metal-dependent hydrolase|nr:endonuclease/exonuclease/phosphatase family protein [Clostridia bacterium]